MKSKILIFVSLLFILSSLFVGLSYSSETDSNYMCVDEFRVNNKIVITSAEHLDSDRNFVMDIYDKVSKLDDIWSNVIADGEYVRVTFEKPLTSENDITIFPRIVDGDPTVEVYEENLEEVVATFENILENEYNKVYLDGLRDSQDTFDLKVVEGSLEFDYIVDPIAINTAQKSSNAGCDGSTCTVSHTVPSGATLLVVTCHTDDGAKVPTSATFNGAGLTELLEESGSGSTPGVGVYYAINPTVTTADVVCSISGGGTKAAVTATTFTGTDTTTPITGETGASAESGSPSQTVSSDDDDYLMDAVSTLASSITAGADQTDQYNLDVGGGGKYAGVSTQFGNVSGDVMSWSVSEKYSHIAFNIEAAIPDTTAPNLTIETPSNNTNTTNTGLDVNFTVADPNLAACWYSNDSYTVNNTLASCANITTVTWAEGEHNVIVWANDSSGNENSSRVEFTVDTKEPNITI